MTRTDSARSDKSNTDEAIAPAGEELEAETVTTLEDAIEAGYLGTRVAHPGPTEDATINRAPK